MDVDGRGWRVWMLMVGGGEWMLIVGVESVDVDGRGWRVWMLMVGGGECGC